MFTLSCGSCRVQLSLETASTSTCPSVRSAQPVPLPAIQVGCSTVVRAEGSTMLQAIAPIARHINPFLTLQQILYPFIS